MQRSSAAQQQIKVFVGSDRSSNNGSECSLGSIPLKDWAPVCRAICSRGDRERAALLAGDPGLPPRTASRGCGRICLWRSPAGQALPPTPAAANVHSCRQCSPPQPMLAAAANVHRQDKAVSAEPVEDISDGRAVLAGSLLCPPLSWQPALSSSVLAACLSPACTSDKLFAELNQRACLTCTEENRGKSVFPSAG
eukprot:CAMPEP_0113703804 /NCGR_PEP_ID=MMETSP0038_2-20120614/26105_1 /TAXON_ID=2898 /ORGANISM="Cryptomonas paramecium" /LENGTH=194 /DNA_ID=CAMNT_0000628391 /DNA_START=138 /DNA_END=724 /DNA_ORIENTATION=+ /assembly_acc=CAM_ASM_000170